MANAHFVEVGYGFGEVSQVVQIEIVARVHPEAGVVGPGGRLRVGRCRFPAEFEVLDGKRLGVEFDAVGADVGADRIELYTESFAVQHLKLGREAAAPYAQAATWAHDAGLGVNAGHDLNLDNLRDFAEAVPHLDEVSIGHALISDALYLGLSNTVAQYRACLHPVK